MHIADVTLFFAPRSGGVKRYLTAKHHHLNLVPGMRHSLLVPGPHDAENVPGIFELKSPRLAGGYRVPLRPWRWRSTLRGLAPDVIEAGDPYHLAWAAIGAADDLGIPAVAFAHSDLARVLRCRFGRAVGAVTERYLRQLYSRFDLVMAPSRTIAAQLARIGVERVVVQNLGVDGDTFHPRRRDEDLRGKLGLAAGVRLLVFAGRMAREKQIPLLVEALARLGSGYHLLLVGGAARAALSANVTVLPYEQDGARLARLLASADALVHAGVHETFGLIVIEAMACGRPIVGMHSGAMTELIDDGVGVLAGRCDASALACAIAALYERDWQQMGRNARTRVEARYAWSSVFALQTERYQRLARRQTMDDYIPADAAGLP